MKTGVISFGLFIVFILVFMTHSSINAESIRADELETSINTALDQTMNTLHDKRYNISNSQELLTEFYSNLLIQLNSDSGIEMKIYSLDSDKGIIDMEIIQEFKYANGKRGKVSTRKTILLNEIENN